MATLLVFSRAPLKREQIIRRLARLWILALVVGSLQPARPAPVVGLHRGIHWLAFAGVALLLLLLSHTRRQEIRGILATCLLGLSLEYLQHLMYHNAMEWRDVRDDTFAIVGAYAIFRSIRICKPVFELIRTTPNPTS